MTARKGILLRNKFSKNQIPGSSLKLVNEYDTDSKSLKILSENKEPFLISNCHFETDESSSGSIFYVKGKFGFLLEINECNFTGNLIPGSYHIDGESNSNDCPNLVVKKYTFSSTAENSIDLTSS